MAWKEVVFEREQLYDDVWKEAVSRVAPRYGLSDVGLRKICKKLDIPLPPLGYWAKLQHGKKPPKAALPKSDGPKTYRHNAYEREADEELDRRLEQARTRANPIPTGQHAEKRTNVGECHVIVRRMASRLNGKIRDSTLNWPVVSGEHVMSMSVSREHRERALFLLDLILQRCTHVGFRVVSPKEEGAPSYVDVDGERFTFRISEKSRREERAPTEAEKRDARLYPALYGARTYYIYKPTGMLQLDVLEVGRSYPTFTMRDGKVDRLEQKTSDLPGKLKDCAVQHKVQRELAAERAKQEEVRRAEQRKLFERREAELKKLKELEEAAGTWERAQRLRRFADAIGACSEVAGGKSLVDWMSRAADWLDPLVKARWPEVDDAPHHAW